MSEVKSPLHIICRNCGYPVTFDIESQTYRCPMCGKTSGIEQTRQESIRLHELHKKELRAQSAESETTTCSGCGAKVFFPQGEALCNCDFCGGRLVRTNAKELGFAPDLVIPFVLNREEAKKHLREWAADHPKAAEARMINSSLEDIQGYYMPYEIVRGPMEVKANRAGLSRTYLCRGGIENTAANCVREMDSALLDAVGPFDLDATVPFEYGCIAGHRALISDLSDNDIDRRVRRQVANTYLPTVKKILHDSDIRIKVTSGQLLSASAMLPVYVLKKGRLSAIVNGQTGRIAVSLKDEEKKTFPFWAVEASVYTLAVTLLLCTVISFSWQYAALFGIFFGLVFFVGMGYGRAPIAARVIKRGEKVRARRRDGKLLLSQGEPSSPLCQPVFYENIDGREVAVEYKFFPARRILSLVMQSLALIFAPVVTAAGIAAATAIANGRRVPEEIAGLDFRGGSIWFIFTVTIGVLLLMQTMRIKAYDRPFIYSRTQTDGYVLVGDPKARRMTIFSSFLFRTEAVAIVETKQGILWAAGTVAVFVLSVWFMLAL